MLERLLLAITVTFLAYLSVESHGYHSASMSTVVQLSVNSLAKIDTVMLKGNN